MEPSSYYAGEGDLAYIEVRRLARGTAPQSDEREWGVIDRDPRTGDVVGIEVWSASQVLPTELLAALPAPGGPAVVVERTGSPARTT